MSIVVAAFPGIGKIHLMKSTDLKFVDLNSVGFKYLSGKKAELNPEFPNNYIAKLKEIMLSNEAPDIIFVPTHSEICRALEKNGIKYFIIYPSINDKNDFIAQYEARGNSERFIVNMKYNWERFIDNIINESFPIHIKAKHISPEMIKSFEKYDDIISASKQAAKSRRLEIFNTDAVNWSIISKERKSWDELDFGYKNYIDWDNLCKFGKVPEKIVNNPAFSKYIVWGYLEKNKGKYSIKTRKLISNKSQTKK